MVIEMRGRGIGGLPSVEETEEGEASVVAAQFCQWAGVVWDW